MQLTVQYKAEDEWAVVLGVSGESFIVADSESIIHLIPIEGAKLGGVHFDQSERNGWADELLRRDTSVEESNHG